MIPSPYFNVNRPMYMNFGASGTHIAINIYKSLLFFGRKWTDGGELLSTDQVDCFRNQYGNSTNANKNNVRIRFTPFPVDESSKLKIRKGLLSLYNHN